MTTTKQLGIWMDHASAHLTEYTKDPMQSTTITSGFTHQIKEDSLHRGEKLMHNKEQHKQSEYYKKISDVMRNYNDIVLFGPTTAKNELSNLIKHDHHFEKIHVVVEHADKMTESHQHAFVREHFSNTHSQKSILGNNTY